MNNQFEPKFRGAGTPTQATKMIAKQRDPVSGHEIPLGINQVPAAIRGCATDIWIPLLTRPYQMDEAHARYLQTLVPFIEMNFRLYAAMAYIQPALVEPMVVVYEINLESGIARYETIALRGDVDPYEDKDLVAYLANRTITAIQWLRVQLPQVPGQAQSYIVRSELLLPAFAGELQLAITRVPIDQTRSQVQIANSCSLGLREIPNNELRGLYRLAEFRPLVNHQQMLREDEQVGQQTEQQIASMHATQPKTAPPSLIASASMPSPALQSALTPFAGQAGQTSPLLFAASPLEGEPTAVSAAPAPILRPVPAPPTIDQAPPQHEEITEEGSGGGDGEDVEFDNDEYENEEVDDSPPDAQVVKEPSIKAPVNLLDPPSQT